MVGPISVATFFFSFLSDLMGGGARPPPPPRSYATDYMGAWVDEEPGVYWL